MPLIRLHFFNLIIQFLECYCSKFTFATVCETWHYFIWLQKWYPQPKAWGKMSLISSRGLTLRVNVPTCSVSLSYIVSQEKCDVQETDSKSKDVNDISQNSCKNRSM